MDFIEKQAEYYSKCSKKEWEKALNSNENYFKKLNLQKYIVGPKLSKQGNIIGNAFVTETMLFYSHANEEQQKFYEILSKLNPTRARHYLLTIIDGLSIWKEDVKILNHLNNALKQELYKLEKEHIELRHEEERLKKLAKNLNELIGENFLKEDYKTMHDLVNDLIKKEEYLAMIKEKLNKEIKQLKKDMPFLF